MKTTTHFLFISFLVLSCLTSLQAKEPVFSFEEKDKNRVQNNIPGDVPSREFVSFKLYGFDQFENKYVLNVSGSFGNLSAENLYVDTLHYHNAFGGIYYNEYIAHHQDNLGRDTMISWTNNEGGSPNYAVKKRLSMKYYKDSGRLLGRYTDVLGFTDLGIATSEEWTIDTMGNTTSFVTQNFDPSSGVRINYAVDSVQITYNLTGNIARQKFLTFDSFQDRIISTENRIYDWNGDTLTSVVVNALNEDGSTDFPKYKIDNISEIQVPHPFEVLHKSIFGTEPWSDASSHRRSKYENDKWEPEYIQDKITFGEYTITTNRWNGNDYEPWKRTRESNFHQGLYERMEFILPRADIESYYKDYAEETYSIDDDRWIPYFETRNTFSLSLNFGLETDTKSATAGDSVLVLIKQTYDPGSGEWLNNFKQEFVFRNLATSVDSEKDLKNNITVFPNPNNGFLNVRINNAEALSKISIVNSLGQSVYTTLFDNFSGNQLYKANLKHLDKGIYFVQIYSGNNMITKKLILQ